MTSSPSFYAPVIVPELQRIQHDFGYLQREALEQFSKRSGVPLYRLQEVASFFPHFQLAAPRKVTLRVCRDMACRMAGSADLLRELAASAGEHVTVEGASCLGRCDRAPAACVAVQGAEHESYFLGRSTGELNEIVAAAAGGVLPPHDQDSALALNCASWRIDPYAPEARDYLAVRQALAARDASLEAAAGILKAQRGWGVGQVEQFRVATVSQRRTAFTIEPEIATAVRAWQTESDWAKGATLV